MKRQLVKWLNVVLSPSIILTIYFSGFSIVGFWIVPNIQGLVSKEVIDRITTVTAKIAIDTAILNLFFNFIFLKLMSLIEITIKISNKDKTKELLIPVDSSEKTKTLEVCIELDYKCSLIKAVNSFVGKNNLNIYIPDGLTYQVKNKSDFRSNCIIDTIEKGVITVNLDSILDESECKNEVYVLLEIKAKPSYKLNKYVRTKVRNSNKNIIFRFISFIFSILFVDSKMDSHSVQARILE